MTTMSGFVSRQLRTASRPLPVRATTHVALRIDKRSQASATTGWSSARTIRIVTPGPVLMRVPPCGSPSTLKRRLRLGRAPHGHQAKAGSRLLAACGRRPTPLSITDIRNSDPALPIEITTLVACACLATLLSASARSKKRDLDLQSWPARPPGCHAPNRDPGSVA